MEGWSRLVMIPALHAGGHGFKSHPLHAIHVIIRTLYKQEFEFVNTGRL
jgi:hypothetical protein